MKKYIAMLLVLALSLCLCACGDETPADTTPAVTNSDVTTPAPVTTPEPTKNSALKTYTVKLVDESGNPITEGGVVQLCLEACTPDMTNEGGVFSWDMIPANYKVSFIKLPNGYTYTSEVQEFYFDEGATEMTITLKAA